MLTNTRIRPLVFLLLLVGTILLLSQLLDLWATVVSSPIDAGSAEWRLRMVGLVVARIPMMILADVLLFAAMIWLDKRAAVQGMGWIHLLLFPVFGAGLLILVRDVLALRNAVPGHSIDIAAVRFGVTLGLTTLLMLLTGWSAVRNSRKPRWGGKKRLMTPLFTDTEGSNTPDRSAQVDAG